jgi:hypothetical protein
MSFREKTAWVGLVSTLVVFVPYFIYVFGLASRRELEPGPVTGAFVALVIFSILLGIVSGIVVAVTSKQEPKDERDAAIESRAYRHAYFVLATLCFTAVGLVSVLSLVRPALPDGRLLAPMLIGQVFLLCFVAAESTKYLTQALSYRRGA